MKAWQAISIGECMLELARDTDGRFRQSFGGDTFNTAVYLTRAGIPTTYATALGDDPYSDGIVATAEEEGVATDFIRRRPGRMPGLYLIETTSEGERTFHYWRDRSPARELFDADDAALTGEAMLKARLIYFSGITLSLYSATGLDRLADYLANARAKGAVVAMDGNYRPRGWGGDAQRARDVLARFWPLATIALPTLDDETALWGDRTADDTTERLLSLGLTEVAVKLGSDGARVRERGRQPATVPVPSSVSPVDTTAAGDSFNAAYLAVRLADGSIEDAALAGHRLAAVVIVHRGAIVPRSATAAVLGV